MQDPLLKREKLVELTFGELEVCASTFLAVLFALFFPGVATNKTGFLECRPQITVEFDQRLGDAVPNGTGLTHHTATENFHLNVELILVVGQPQRL